MNEVLKFIEEYRQQQSYERYLLDSIEPLIKELKNTREQNELLVEALNFLIMGDEDESEDDIDG